jgi:hypothetical protein
MLRLVPPLIEHDEPAGDVDERIAGLLRQLVAARARAMHPAGSGLRIGPGAEIVDLR